MTVQDLRFVNRSSSTEVALRRELTQLFKSCPIPEDEIQSNLGLFINRQSMARFLWIHELYRNIINVPGGSRLWYDTRDIAFLQADITDAANVQQIEAQSIKSLIDSGYEPDSIVKAVQAQDWSLLQHTGLFSVQLQPPMPEGPPAAPALPDPMMAADASARAVQLSLAPLFELQERKKPDIIYVQGPTIESPHVDVAPSPVNVFNKTMEEDELRSYAQALPAPQVNVDLSPVARMIGEVEARRIVEQEKHEAEKEAQRAEAQAEAERRHNELVERLKPPPVVKMTRRVERDENGLLALIVDEPEEESG